MFQAGSTALVPFLHRSMVLCLCPTFLGHSTVHNRRRRAMLCQKVLIVDSQDLNDVLGQSDLVASDSFWPERTFKRILTVFNSRYVKTILYSSIL